MYKELIGKFVITIDGHSGVVIKQFKPTGRSITIHIKENDGRIWYCPISDVIKIGEIMNKEEIEELKEFTIDLTDIDELALGLEVCSKKSNMVIQEFADTIIQLQQENQSLKKENKILRENAEHNDKVVDKFNWENLKLKEQVEEYKKLGFKHLNDKCNKLERGEQ